MAWGILSEKVRQSGLFRYSVLRGKGERPGGHRTKFENAIDFNLNGVLKKGGVRMEGWGCGRKMKSAMGGSRGATEKCHSGGPGGKGGETERPLRKICTRPPPTLEVHLPLGGRTWKIYINWSLASKDPENRKQTVLWWDRAVI